MSISNHIVYFQVIEQLSSFRLGVSIPWASRKAEEEDNNGEQEESLPIKRRVRKMGKQQTPAMRKKTRHLSVEVWNTKSPSVHLTWRSWL